MNDKEIPELKEKIRIACLQLYVLQEINEVISRAFKDIKQLAEGEK